MKAIIFLLLVCGLCPKLISRIILALDEGYFILLNYHLAFFPTIYGKFWGILNRDSLSHIPIFPILLTFFFYLRQENYSATSFYYLLFAIVFFECIFMSVNFICFNHLDINRLSPTMIHTFIDLRDYFSTDQGIKISSAVSMPSGHAMVLSYWCLLNEDLNKKRFKTFSFLFSAILCLKRVIGGAHWVSDLFSGFFISFITFNIYKELAKFVFAESQSNNSEKIVQPHL